MRAEAIISARSTTQIRSCLAGPGAEGRSLRQTSSGGSSQVDHFRWTAQGDGQLRTQPIQESLRSRSRIGGQQ